MPDTPPPDITSRALAHDLDRIRKRLADSDDAETLIAFERVASYMVALDQQVAVHEAEIARMKEVEGFEAFAPILDRLFPGMKAANLHALRELQRLSHEYKAERAKKNAIDRMLLDALDRFGSIPTTAKASARSRRDASQSGRRDASTSAARDASKKNAKKAGKRR